jgi:cell division protein FtsI/penicillin-binding protein 2
MQRKIKNFQNRGNINRKMNSRPTFRLIFLTLILLSAFVLLLGKLVKVQIIKHAYYQEEARKNKLLKREVAALRGTIFDRHGRELAKDVIQYSLAIRPSGFVDKQKVISQVSQVLDIPITTIKDKLKSKSKYIFIDKRVSPENAELLKKIKDPSIELEKRFLRTYPYKENGAHFVGFCGLNNEPLGGVEYQYNHLLQGKAGWKYYLRDALGNQFPNLDYVGEDPIDGLDIVLTIDMDYQEILSDELRKAVEKNKAKEGVAILMAAKTGEILALANYPQFDPNFPNRYRDDERKNKAITDIFEPGSTLKFIALAAGLENLKVDLDKSIYFCENGSYRLRNKYVHDHKKFAWLTLRKVIENSSNIGTMKFVSDLDRKTFYRYVRNFGFGMVTSIDLPGESPGLLQSLDDFSATTQQYMSIGYEIGVTPLQLVAAYSALANGGKLYKPFILNQVFNTDKRVVTEKKPQLIREVISPKTAELICDVLVGVVENGTGQNAFLKDISIAGKTGTAQLYNPETGKYDNTQHAASFVGYFPAHNPHFTLLVNIKRPESSPWGGVVAAPAFKNMAERIYSLSDLETERYAIQADSVETPKETAVPDVKGLTLDTAKELLSTENLLYKIYGSGATVLNQEVGQDNEKNVIVALYTDTKGINNESLMPTLKGLSLKEALTVLHNFEIVPLVEGYGIVVQQSPTPGVKINKNKNVKLVCRPT